MGAALSKFRIKQKELTIDGETVIVRGMSYAETRKFRETFASDKESAIPLVASMCCVQPRLSLEEANETATHVLMMINAAVFELSGMRDAIDEGNEKKV